MTIKLCFPLIRGLLTYSNSLEKYKRLNSKANNNCMDAKRQRELFWCYIWRKHVLQMTTPVNSWITHSSGNRHSCTHKHVYTHAASNRESILLLQQFKFICFQSCHTSPWPQRALSLYLGYIFAFTLSLSLTLPVHLFFPLILIQRSDWKPDVA